VARDLADLQQLALRLDGETVDAKVPPLARGINPVEVQPGLWLSDLPGAVLSPPETVVISLCRTFGHITHEQRRQVYLTDDDSNLDPVAAVQDVVADIEALHDDGRQVLVHCWGGASRTGLVLRAWLKRTHGLSTQEANDEAARVWPHLGRWNTSFEDALDQL
jgi:ADP-ribosyl-[dinitrogen reductase] hydrolase